MSHMTNCLVTPEQIYRRSSFSNLPTDLQDSIFFSTQCLTQAAGLLLTLPQSVTAQANALLARYWLVEPVLGHAFSVCSPLLFSPRGGSHAEVQLPSDKLTSSSCFQDVSAASLFLAAKLGPSPGGPATSPMSHTYLGSPSSPLLRTAQDLSPQKPDDPRSYTLSDAAYQSFHGRLLAPRSPHPVHTCLRHARRPSAPARHHVPAGARVPGSATRGQSRRGP